jgi:pimeloyl-ACP methyl ester carboxylesterase
MDHAPVASKLNVNGVELAVWEWPGAGPAVLFCHATGFHARSWDQVIAHLAGRRCIAFDARGHGRSSKPAPPYHWRDFGADTAAVAGAFDLSGAVGVGHSMGGHAVTLAAALRPDAFSSLLLLDPVIRSQASYIGPWHRAQFVAKRRNRWSSPEEMIERFQSRTPFNAWNPAVLRDYCEYGLIPNGDGFVLACPPEIEAGIYENSPAPESNIYPEIAAIDIPVHIVRGGRETDPENIMSMSPTTPDLASHFRRATDRCLAQYSHFIPMEAPETVANWIAELLPRGASKS